MSYLIMSRPPTDYQNVSVMMIIVLKLYLLEWSALIL